MQLKRHLPAALAVAAIALLALALGCSSSSSGGDAPASPAAGSLALSVSDAATEDWAVIGVKLLGVTLTPQGGGTAQTILATPAQAPVLNLVQLDSLSDVLGSASVPAGTYTQATLTLAANPGDVLLTAAASPSASFAGTPGAAIPAADIQIKGAQGATGSLTSSVTVTLAQPLVVEAGQQANLDLEFQLSHPAFIVDHVPASGDTKWTVNFSDTVRHHPVTAPETMVLRQLYGTFTGAPAGALTLVRDFPTLPVATPQETATATLQTVQLSADPDDGGTLFYDVDAGTMTPVTDFSSVAATLATAKYVRATVRFQAGTLVAVRLWASASFNSVWLSPEGHVTHVVAGGGATPAQIDVEAENGAPVPVTITDDTRFYFRTPSDPMADATPLGTGTGLLGAPNLVRGFKVHVSCVDPLAATLVADSVDIETASYTGDLSAATGSGFTDTRAFVNSADDYTTPLAYLPAGTANGNDTAGNPVLGFQWWNATQPGLADTGAGAAADFAGTVTGSVDFGGSVGPVKVWGDSVAIPDASQSNLWDARWTVLEPVRLPKGTVVAPFAASGTGGAFSMTVKGGDATPVTVAVTSAATLAYQIDLSGGVYTLTPVDLASLATTLAAASPVVVFGVPQAGGTILAYVLYSTATNAL